MSVQALLLAHTLRALTGLEPDPTQVPGQLPAQAQTGTKAEVRAEVVLSDTEVEYVEATWSETVIRGRPWVPHKRVATVSEGTRLVVRGVVESRDDKGCKGKPWYAVYPFGYVCSQHVRETKKAPAPGTAMALGEGKRLPFTYAYVRADGVPLYAGYADIDAGIPTRPLTKGMSVVVARSLEYDGYEWIQTRDGAFIPKSGIRYGGQGSAFAGVEFSGDDSYHGPSFAWTHGVKGTRVRTAPSPKAEIVQTLPLRTRVPLLERADSQDGGGEVFWRVGEGQWIDASVLNEVHLIEPPADVLAGWRSEHVGNDQWVDVDLGEQVLVAYRGHQAMFATMISSGRSHATPRGNYPMWAKVASTTMANQAYEDKPYMVQGVPWVVLFQGHNALHGAYWHDKFGNKKSHGCVNLAPLDARWVFEWVGPSLPVGWTGYLPSDLQRSPVIHVRDSSKAAEFVQERPIGPPDREAEKARAEEAEARRAAAAVDAPVLDPSDRYDPSFVPGGRVSDTLDVGGQAQGDGESGARLEAREDVDLLPG